MRGGVLSRKGQIIKMAKMAQRSQFDHYHHQKPLSKLNTAFI